MERNFTISEVIVGVGVPTNCTGITSQTIVTTGWTRISCTITTDGTTPAADAYVLIMQTAGTARTFYLDGVQLDAGGTATPYGAGNFFFNGSITSPMTFKNQANSTDAFKIQDSASTALFQVDTLNARVYVGNPTADATGTLLVLDTKNTAGDPTGINGGMYYNSNAGAFRCYENGAWKNCIGPTSNASVADQALSASSTTYLTGSSIAVGNVRAGSTFNWRITMTKTAAGTLANTFNIRFGTGGSTADTSRCSFAMGTQTAAIDTAVIELTTTVRSVGATATMACNYRMTHTATATTGFDNALSTRSINVTSATFDDTVAGSIIGVSYTTAAAYVITIQQVQATTTNL